MAYDHVNRLYQRAKSIVRRKDEELEYDDRILNELLALLVKNKEHPVNMAERLNLGINEIRGRVTLAEPGIVHCEPSDFRRTGDYIEETLRGDTQNLAMAPMLRVRHLLYKMADEYERSQEANRQMNLRKEREAANDR